MSQISVLIPTYGRLTPLAVTLSSLIPQVYRDFEIIISEQNRDSIFNDLSIQTLLRRLQLDHQITLAYTFPEGMANHRQQLLNMADSPYVLFLDDDLLLDPFVIHNLIDTIKREQCGFIGAAPIGLNYLEDVRPEEQAIEYWTTPVKPEKITPDSYAWYRYKIHNAANLWHIATQLNPHDSPRLYKIAWIGGCVLYDRQKLLAAGGFNFWKSLPRDHVGEDVYVELKVMEKYGGCGIIPSGVYHQEVPTTMSDRSVNTPEYL